MTAVLERAGIAIDAGSVRVTKSEYASTARAFVVRCLTVEREELLLYCKEGTESNQCHGHRGDCLYEARVYEEILGRTAGVTTARWYGSWRDPANGVLWMLMEHLSGEGLSPVNTLDALERAAEWIGLFHRRARGVEAPFLIRYDRAYFRGWITRAASFAEGGAPEWLRELAGKRDRVAEILLDAPASVIHGEYYPHNVLGTESAIYPVDWESAAVGPGEIDLAALTDDWDKETVRATERSYVAARWRGSPPAGFERTLTAARLYWHSRWLGDRPRWANHPKAQWRWAEMRAAAESLGVISAP